MEERAKIGTDGHQCPNCSGLGLNSLYSCKPVGGQDVEVAPEEVTVDVHIAPAAPTGLKKNSYNKTTDVLVLDAA